MFYLFTSVKKSILFISPHSGTMSFLHFGKVCHEVDIVDTCAQQKTALQALLPLTGCWNMSRNVETLDQMLPGITLPCRFVVKFCSKFDILVWWYWQHQPQNFVKNLAKLG